MTLRAECNAYLETGDGDPKKLVTDLMAALDQATNPPMADLHFSAISEDSGYITWRACQAYGGIVPQLASWLEAHGH